MRILIDVGHPGHVHLFKNMIFNLQSEHEVIVTAKPKESTVNLLEAYSIPYHTVSNFQSDLFKKAVNFPLKMARLYKFCKKFNPDILIGVHDMYIAQLGKLIRKPSIIFTDTEEAKFADAITFPFADVICTPECYMKDIGGGKHVRYNGYHELAYLHPNYFKAEEAVLDELGVSKNDRVIVVRLISLDAYHDVDLKGINRKNELAFIRALEDYGRVFISSGKPLGRELEKYALRLPPEKFHSVLAFADLCIGDGGTTAVEAAVLGTPAIHIEADAGGRATGETSGNFMELRDRYSLLYFYPDEESALATARNILENKNSKAEWGRKRELLLRDKVDVTAWMTGFIEGFPGSFYDRVGKGV
ncbi:MAG: DUF354 domain-containing protein [Candidatus Methanoperedens sp.]|nr:DUF354 domain-containing protein [Candidatus Methanoperedens sp.]